MACHGTITTLNMPSSALPNIAGTQTAGTLEAYLVLASVFETCEFNNVNALQFLLSKEATFGRAAQNGWALVDKCPGIRAGCLHVAISRCIRKTT